MNGDDSAVFLAKTTCNVGIRLNVALDEDFSIPERVGHVEQMLLSGAST